MKLLNFIKKHCFLFVSLLIILIVLIVGIIIMKKLFFSNSGDVFGNRLEGIEKHVISDETLNKFKVVVWSSLFNKKYVEKPIIPKIKPIIITINIFFFFIFTPNFYQLNPILDLCLYPIIG